MKNICNTNENNLHQIRECDNNKRSQDNKKDDIDTEIVRLNMVNMAPVDDCYSSKYDKSMDMLQKIFTDVIIAKDKDAITNYHTRGNVKVNQWP